MKKNNKWIVLICPCGKKVFKVKNPKEGYKFFCPCGDELLIKKEAKEWVLEPADGIWKIEEAL
jgi:hypothetical protein